MLALDVERDARGDTWRLPSRHVLLRLGQSPTSRDAQLLIELTATVSHTGRHASRRGQPLPANSRLHVTADMGPPVPDELLYRVVDALEKIAGETGKTVPQVALNWLLQRPTVSSVVIGARDEQQLRQNLGAVGWNLTKEQVAELDVASTTTLAYPYWHQRGFVERNPAPV